MSQALQQPVIEVSPRRALIDADIDSGLSAPKDGKIGKVKEKTNANLAPLDDPKVREALRAAVNVDGLLQGLYAGWYDKAWTNVTPVTPPLGSYDESLEGSFSYDLEAAGELLDEAGWLVGDDGVRVKDGQRLTLEWKDDAAFLAQDQRLQLGEGVIASLAEAGIEVNRTQYDSSAYRDELAKNTHHLAPSSRGFADVATAVAPLITANDPRTPGGYINYGLLEDAEIDAWYAELISESDPARRIEIAHEVQRKANEEVYTVPLYVPKKLVGTSEDVHGWLFDSVGYTDTFYNVWLSEG